MEVAQQGIAMARLVYGGDEWNDTLAAAAVLAGLQAHPEVLRGLAGAATPQPTSAEPEVGDVVAWADDPCVPGKVIAVVSQGRLRVWWPNGEAEVPAADLVPLRAGGGNEAPVSPDSSP
jgi:hypothetical protein